MATPILTALLVRELFDYDRETGALTFRVRRGHKLAGSKACRVDKNGYISVRINGKHYAGHRLAWLHVHGEWPKGDIDHIDGNRANNRLANLRDVTRKVNLQNRRLPKITNKTSSSLGVSSAKGKFQARIYVDGRHINLGTFDTEKDASHAYLAAKRKYHEGCTI